jgi:hypothetical protein
MAWITGSKLRVRRDTQGSAELGSGLQARLSNMQLVPSSQEQLVRLRTNMDVPWPESWRWTVVSHGGDARGRWTVAMDCGDGLWRRTGAMDCGVARGRCTGATHGGDAPGRCAVAMDYGDALGRWTVVSHGGGARGRRTGAMRCGVVNRHQVVFAITSKLH